MKIRRFTELDLARFVVLAGTPSLEPSLKRYDSEGGSWSYDPVRNSTADILGASTPLFGALDGVPWERIESQISAACKHGDVQREANVQVGRALFDEALRRRWQAVKLSMGRMPIGSGEYVRYWSDVVLGDNNGPFVPYFDHRRENGASKQAIQRVIFSIQHLWVRERNPDLTDARLAIVRFSNSLPRTPSLSFHDGTELMSFEELDSRVRLVYETWADILRDKVPAPRKTGTSGIPSLFD